AANNVDCDDSDSGVYPNAPEFCNNTDDDCDGTIDDGLFTQEFFADADQDGFGGPSIGQWCYPPPNSATSTSDCNDNDESIYPGSTETCNTYDDDCDGSIDEGLLNSFFLDNDGDGYGNPGLTILACFASPGIVSNNEDCDDTQASVFPGNTEILDALDNDCDGVIDNSMDELTQLATWRVYPNPAQTQITILAEGLRGTANYRLLDAIGAVVGTGQISPGKQQTVDISAWANGYYVLQVEGANAIAFVKE
ncbi:MAG: MopE-related protein, partial [Flavobacteriales bacterium]